MATTLKSKVANGAKVLDLISPGWAKRLNLKKLDLEDCDRCVLGQLFNGYFGTESTILRYQGVELGYSFPEDVDDDEAWENLTELWKEQIRKRRN